jgi:phosphoribosylamine--glycine ligase
LGPRSAVGVVLATPGYPETPEIGARIQGLDDLPEGVVVFHAGTTLAEDGRVVTAGGRILTIVGMGATVDEAADRAYSTSIHFEGMQWRSDIAWQAREVKTYA